MLEYELLTTQRETKTTLTGAFQNVGGGAVLKVNNNLVITNISVALVSNIKIAVGGKALTVNAGNNNITPVAGTGWVFGDADSAVVFNVDATGNKNITFGGNVVTGGGDKGKIEFNATTAGTLTITSGGTTLGTNNARLKEVKLLALKKILHLMQT